MVSNACCNEGNKNTLGYFIEKENSILDINKTVYELEMIDSVCKYLNHPLYLLHDKSTKLNYPTVMKGFSEEVIYKFIIEHCKFNTGIDINEKYKLVCGENNSSFKQTDSIADKISILKAEAKTILSKILLLNDIIDKKCIKS